MVKMTCIMCPMGCALEGDNVNGEIAIKGYTCKRGLDYGKQEFVAPMRVVTSLVKIGKNLVVPVKTSNVVPKEKIKDVLHEIKMATAIRPIKIGDIIIHNVLNLNVDIIATKEINR